MSTKYVNVQGSVTAALQRAAFSAVSNTVAFLSSAFDVKPGDELVIKFDTLVASGSSHQLRVQLWPWDGATLDGDFYDEAIIPNINTTAQQRTKFMFFPFKKAKLRLLSTGTDTWSGNVTVSNRYESEADIEGT